MADITDWLEEQSQPGIKWYMKRLSGNDTLANGSHQAGPYVPKEIIFDVFPTINRTDELNPRHVFTIVVDSHPDVQDATAIYYNNKPRGEGTRNEARLTGFGGASSALLDPDSTGALAIFAFYKNEGGSCNECHAWVCEGTQEDIVEERFGPIEPGTWKTWSLDEPDLFSRLTRDNCWLSPAELPVGWLTKFPTGAEIVHKSVELCPSRALDVDLRLIKRRKCEFEIFQSVEEAIELPNLTDGFDNINDFVARAQTILQRRKARSGRSLELHAKEILVEEQFEEGVSFAYQARSEGNKSPDFIFPSQEAYLDANFPAEKLRMLAVKTTCKDRWRQILNEADRIEKKHLLTLQEGVSENQFREMSDAGVQLVVPSKLHSKYPSSVQPYLQTLESFLGDVRFLADV